MASGDTRAPAGGGHNGHVPQSLPEQKAGILTAITDLNLRRPLSLETVQTQRHEVNPLKTELEFSSE